MKKNSCEIIDVLVRYFILLVIPLNGLWIFYFVFTPLTIYPVYFILGLFSDVSIFGNLMVINRQLPIEFINACIAGAAYYFLLILNLATPKINLRKRIIMVVLSFIAFLFFNLLRIFLLIGVIYSGYLFFDIAHVVFWYSISTIFVVAIWFVQVKIFRIKKFPFYSDLKHFYSKTIR